MSKYLDKLLSQLVNLHPKYIDLSLHRLNKLLEKIGNPHLKLPKTIHIAGTNGKGSTLSFINNILKENKYLVHVYTSPHLKSFNERIILANKIIKTEKLLKTLKKIKKINSNKPITFFEITTAAALYLFAKEKADFLILETGLGGRLDATNVIQNSILDIITPIGIDHQDYLGSDIKKIANEKLGIIKKNSNIIIGKQKKIIDLHIKKKLKNKKNNKLFYNKDYKVLDKTRTSFKLKFKNTKYKFSNPTLKGDHQIYNASIAIIAILQLNNLGYSFKEKTINNGIKKTLWPGRLEEGKLNTIKVYLDGAHNIDGSTQLLKYFKNKKNKIWIILGMMNNKDLNGFLKKLKPIIEGVIGIKIPDEKNSYTSEEILEICKKNKINCYAKSSIIQANHFLEKKIKPKELLICGSLYLIGKIRNKYL